jgi:hypothetical protein
MTTSASALTPRTRWRKRVVWAAVLLVVAVASSDFAQWHVRKQRALDVVFELGGRAGSIGGWPLGEEIVITFERELTDEDFQRLAILNTLSGRHYVGVHLADGNLSDTRLAWIQEILSNCHVHRQDRGQ